MCGKKYKPQDFDPKPSEQQLIAQLRAINIFAKKFRSRTRAEKTLILINLYSSRTNICEKKKKTERFDSRTVRSVVFLATEIDYFF